MRGRPARPADRRWTVETLQAEIKHLEAMQLALTTQGYDHAKERAYTG